MLIINICRTIFDLFIPSMCAICSARLNIVDSTICKDCLDDINGLPRIGLTNSAYAKEIWSIFPYTGKVKECLRIFKFKERKNIIIDLENMIKDFLTRNPAIGHGIDIIVPVPMGPADIRKGRINHAALIAETLSRLLSVTIDKKILLKIKNTAKQASLKKDTRLKNLRGSFKAVRKNPLAGKNVLIVDDIITTGATIDACARELLKAKAQNIFAFTLARTL